MAADPLTTRARTVAEPVAGSSIRDTWHELETLVDDLAGLAKLDLSAGEFYASLLDRAIRALAASGGAVWLRGPQGLRIEYQINAAPSLASDKRGGQEAHARWLETVAHAGEVKTLPPNSGTSREASPNPTDFFLLAGPLKLEEEPLGVIEIFQRPGASPAAQRGYVQLLGVLCEVAVDFHRNLHLRELKRVESLWSQFDRFAEVAHDSLKLDRVAYTIANEGRRLLECNRVSVAICRTRKPRLAAISGIDEFDPRSNVVRLLERIAAAVLATREPLWYRGESAHLSPQLETALEDYVEETHVRFLAAIPLLPAANEGQPAGEGPAPPPVGVLLVEDFEVPADEGPLRQRTPIVARHATAALRNALAYRNIPFSPVLEALGRMTWFVRLRQLPLTVLALAAVAGVVAALALVPAPFTIEGRGELQPAVRRDIFAPSDGVVSELLVEHGDKVSEASPSDPSAGLLLRLRNLELEFEQTRLVGERQTAETELAAVLAARLSATVNSLESREQYNQLTAKEEELRELLKSLATQLEVVKKQQAILAVRSPISGQVLTWNVSQTLESRPVKRGQVLLSVAQTDGPWILEMHVPDQHIGYVLSAQQEKQEDLEVSFLLKTDPGVTYRGKIISVAKTTDGDAVHAGTVLVTVSFDRREIQGLRPGATVVARIDCGRRSIGYVWFHDLIESIRTKLLF